MIEEEIEKIIEDPNQAILPEQAREAINNLNASIDDKRQEEVDREKAYHAKWIELRKSPDITNDESTHQAKMSDEYNQWKQTKNELASLRDKKSVLEKKYSLLDFQVYKRGRI